ncbi:hypothetical protein HYFRA_00011565 [Hymenoscyphus fraxineus]|uniref:Uncharacterized protein n=1 Tax=Hymenoscyphus fraxineus TaxID=746836 RepID=A0A9N9L840_9HELO|nr:hypothetical protein HYFRA_00011565 [Hymenoscyphus fraxineus]
MVSVRIATLGALAASVVSAASIPNELAERQTSPASYATAYLDIEKKIADFGCAPLPADHYFNKEKYVYFIDVLSDYYSIIASPLVTATDKSACGTCVEVTYTTDAGEKNKVYGVTVDGTGGYYNFDLAGYAGLGGREPFNKGTLQVKTKTVDLKKCERQRQ